jgi:hypothetical protein
VIGKRVRFLAKVVFVSTSGNLWKKYYIKNSIYCAFIFDLLKVIVFDSLKKLFTKN